MPHKVARGPGCPAHKREHHVKRNENLVSLVTFPTLKTNRRLKPRLGQEWLVKVNATVRSSMVAESQGPGSATTTDLLNVTGTQWVQDKVQPSCMHRFEDSDASEQHAVSLKMARMSVNKKGTMAQHVTNSSWLVFVNFRHEETTFQSTRDPALQKQGRRC